MSATAAIDENKLGSIATYGKVNATAITGLTNMAAGAGPLPIANLPIIGVYGKVLGSAISGLTNIASAAGVIPVANIPPIENRTSDPVAPVVGKMWIRTDL